MKIRQYKNLHCRSKFHGSKGFRNFLKVKTAASKRALVDHSTTIENEQDQSIILSRCPGITNDLIYNNKINSIQHILSYQSIGEIPVSVFLQSFRENGAQFISSAYLTSSRHSINRSTINGILSTSLPEDIFTLIDAQLTLLDEYLGSANLINTDTGNVIIMDALLSIFRTLYCKQIHYGHKSLFSQDLDSFVARTNDYWRMAEKSEHMVHDLSKLRYPYLLWNNTSTKSKKKKENSLSELDRKTNLVEQKGSNLIDLFTSHTIQASQRTAIYIIKAIHQCDIPLELFSRHWEEYLTNNEVTKYIVRVYGDYLSDMKQSLETEYLYDKVVCTLIRCTVCFYIKSFILKADRIRHFVRRRKSNRIDREHFINPKRAIFRMHGDIELFEKFFQSMSEGRTTLKKIIINEFSVLNALFLECLSYAAGQSCSNSLEEFIIVVHKRTGADSDVTRCFLSDIFISMSTRNDHHSVEGTIRKMRADLDKIKESMEMEHNKTSSIQATKEESSYFQLDEMLKSIYEDQILQENAAFCGTIADDVRKLKLKIIRKSTLP